MARALRTVCMQLSSEACAKHMGHSSRTQGSFLQLLGSEMLWASTNMSRAAVLATELLFPCLWLPMKPPHVMIAVDPMVPHVPSCIPRPHTPEDRLELPWVSAQTQYCGIPLRSSVPHRTQAALQ